jgi:hypothetical protein
METATATPQLARHVRRVREYGRCCRCINIRHKRAASVHQKLVRSSVADSEQPRERDLTMATAKSVESHGDIEAGRGGCEATSPVPAPRGERLVSLDVFRGVTVAVSKLSSSSSPASSYVRSFPLVHRMQASYVCSLVDDQLVWSPCTLCQCPEEYAVLRRAGARPAARTNELATRNLQPWVHAASPSDTGNTHIKEYIYINVCIICFHVLAALASLERRNIRNGRLPLVRATRCVVYTLFVFAIKVRTHFHCFTR